jgi:hypothetical protein
MANSLFLDFTLQFVSDGSSGTVSVNVKSGPIGFAPPGSASVLPDVTDEATGAINLAGDWTGSEVTFASVSHDVLTLDITPIPPDGEAHTITGRVVF